MLAYNTPSGAFIARKNGGVDSFDRLAPFCTTQNMLIPTSWGKYQHHLNGQGNLCHIIQTTEHALPSIFTNKTAFF